MALYIHPENQELLWKIINNNPYVNEMFSKINPTQRSEWFKSIVAKFYTQVENKNLTVDELHMLNKDTLSYMVKYTQNIIAQTQAPTQASPPQLQQQYPVNSRQMQPPQSPSSPQQQYPQQQYPQQQQPQYQYQQQQPTANITDYKSIVEKKEPEAIDFKEKFEDTAIKNMDELVEKHRRERELEMNAFTSQVGASVVPNVAPPQPQKQEPPQQNIHYEVTSVNTPTTTRSDTRPNEDLLILKEFAKQLTEIQETIVSMKKDMTHIMSVLSSDTTRVQGP